ncbi:hypothetical protein BVRB_7g156930 [Beta vulgaris subsp. vulgaris]|nr:hypothetical protein BVRB_7g156930 [Beta vulgaris subsp. vulgaris]
MKPTTKFEISFDFYILFLVWGNQRSQRNHYKSRLCSRALP